MGTPVPPGPTAKTAPKRKATLKGIRAAPAKVKADAPARAYLILKYAHDSAAAMLKAFDSVRLSRGAATGTTTDEEQDLLRAMLVFAAAGLDSMLKQGIRDCLHKIVVSDTQAHDELENFAARRFRRDTDAVGASDDSARFLARILSAESPQRQLIEEYVDHLVGGSLQSPEELIKATKALGLDPGAIGIKPTELRPVFRIRNQIIHELDINFEHPKRNRQTRAREAMRTYTNQLLDIASAILIGVDTKCATADAAEA